MSSTRLSALLDGILEVGWLAAIVIAPLFFNTSSNRVFEPDKLSVVRSIAFVMAAAWLLRLVEEWAGRRRESGQASPLLRIGWRTPMVLPTLFTAVVYLVSAAFSVSRFVSFFGSYVRLQGTFTTLSYAVIFLIILDRMRTPAQVDRFITTLILNSLPIALYGFVQHSGRDPLPWLGDVTQRVASNMGNPIFVAAYMIMVVPPTLARIVDSFRSILTDAHAGTLDVLRAAAYIFSLLVQLISIWYSGSRGPLMGLVVGLSVWGLLGLLALQRAAQREQPFDLKEIWRDLGLGAAFALGSLAAAGAVAVVFYFVSGVIAPPGSGLSKWVAAIAAVVALLAVWMAFIVNRRGWRWLWISALMFAVLFVAGFLAINLVQPVREWSRQQPWLGRLEDVLQHESGTGMVRSLMWGQMLELILPHDPLEYPPTIEDDPLASAEDLEWRADPFNALRPLVGYGPETTFVAANRFYPPLLGQYESRGASPDRAHNETLDSLVITGLLGFVAYLWLFGSLFAFGLRWLGFVSGGRWRVLLVVLLAAGSVVATAATTASLGAHFFGLAVPAGMVGGLLVYLLVRAFSLYWEAEPGPEPHPHLILLMAVTSAFAAHFIEIQFGIAVAATRTTFWAMMGVLVLLGLRWIADEEPVASEPVVAPSAGRRRRRRAATASGRTQPTPSALPAWLWPALGAALVGALILGTLFYDFVINREWLDDPLRVLWRSLTVDTTGDGPPQTSPGVLMFFTLSWLLAALLSIAQMVQRGVFGAQRSDERVALLVVLTASLVAGAVFGFVFAARRAHTVIASAQVQSVEGALQVSEYDAGYVAAYYLLLAFVLLLGGVALAGERRLPRPWATPVGTMALLAAGLSWAVVFLGSRAAGVDAATRLSTLALAFVLGAGAAAGIGLTVYVTSPPFKRRLLGVGWLWGLGLVAALVVFAAPVISYAYNLRPVQADIIQKRGLEWEQQGQYAAAIAHYQRAMEMAPWEDQYYMFLGRTYLTYAPSAEDTAEQMQWLQAAEATFLQAQILNPLHTDHPANLARVYESWARLPAGQEHHQRLLELSSRSFEIALGLSPNNVALWNEWAFLYYDGLEDTAGYERTIEHSLSLDPDFDETWLIQGDVHMTRNELPEAAADLARALELSPDVRPQPPRTYWHWTYYSDALAWYPYGYALLATGQTEHSIEALLEVLAREPDGAYVWDCHRLLAVAYQSLGDGSNALYHAQAALQLVPEDQRPLVEQLFSVEEPAP